MERGQKVLSNYVVLQGSKLEEALVSEIEWPGNCLLVAIQRGSDEIRADKAPDGGCACGDDG